MVSNNHPELVTLQSCDPVLVGNSPVIRGVLQMIEFAAEVDAAVLISGETGTGKNVVANAIHTKSKKTKKNLIRVNCAALPENLIEAELFGYEKGSFTGAFASRRGLIEMAHGGTLFLDEISEMPFHLQAKLLGVLEDKMVRRLGSSQAQPVDFRVVAATSKQLERHLEKTFRSDLYYRLSVIRIELPPLRERRDDIPLLCQHLLQQADQNRHIALDPIEINRLMNYDWPGNVRELKNLLERALIVHKGRSDKITPSRLISKHIDPYANEDSMAQDDSLESMLTLREMERRHIQVGLEKHNYNLSRTAKTLGISLSTLKRKLKGYGLR